MRVHCWLAGALVCASALLPKVCHAQSLPHRHDGFYLQMTVGAGYLSSSADFGAIHSRIYGGALAGSLWMGGSVMPGFALGGGLIGDIAFAPSQKLSGGGMSSTTRAGTDQALQLQMIGLVTDIYPNPKQGLHFQAMLGYAVLSVSNNGDTGDVSPSGVGVLGGVGYDFWISEEWSMGVLGRVAYAAAKLNDQANPTIAPALLASFTYN